MKDTDPGTRSVRSPSKGHQGGAGGEGSSRHTSSPVQMVSVGFPRTMWLERSSGTTGQSDRMETHAGHSRPALGPPTNMACALGLSVSWGRASPRPNCPQLPRRGHWKWTEAKGPCLPFSCPVQPERCLQRSLKSDALLAGFVRKLFRENNVWPWRCCSQGSPLPGGSQGRGCFSGKQRRPDSTFFSSQDIPFYCVARQGVTGK